jgi:hypothetical protein
MYTLQGKTRPTQHVRFTRQSTYARHTLPAGSPRTWQPFTSHWYSWTESLLSRKRAPDIIHSIPTDWSTGPYPVSLPSQPMKQWRKPNIYRRQATRLTRPISPVCYWYVQYLLMGTNPLVLHRHRQGLPHRNLEIATTLSPPFPSECSTDPPKWPHPVSILSNINHQYRECLSTYCQHVVFQPLGVYRHLCLHLAIFNDL